MGFQEWISYNFNIKRIKRLREEDPYYDINKKEKQISLDNDDVDMKTLIKWCEDWVDERRLKK